MVKDNTVSNYGKNGITVNCELATGEIYDYVVKAEACFLLAMMPRTGSTRWGATGEVYGNTITDHWWIGCSKPDATQSLCTYWVAAGLLLYDVEPGLVNLPRTRTVQEKPIRCPRSELAIAESRPT